MKKLILLLGILVFVAGCNTTSEPVDKQKDEIAMKNMQIVKEYFLATENEDMGKIEELLADDFLEVGPGSKEEYNREKSIESFKNTFEAYDSIQFSITAITTEHKTEGDLAGDWVMSWNWFKSKNVKMDKTVKLMYHGAFKVKDGEIVLLVNYWDRWDLYKQLGAELEWDDEDEDEGDEEDDD